MLYKRIMVAYDGSASSKAALIVAKNMIGQDDEAQLHIVSVIPLSSMGIGVDAPIEPLGGGVQQIFPDMQTYESLLDNAKASTVKSVKETIGEELENAKCEIHVEAVGATKPAAGICEYATDRNMDMIVMGNRGLGALRSMLGSVSYQVLHEAEVPVVTVK